MISIRFGGAVNANQYTPMLGDATAENLGLPHR